ncbi:hypothetical protein CKO28_08165 [Rhodovibrio sodomensis]|uniref:DUF1232 domain-containing protein n=1 Tax=Rhodovibrio sodomensis TaxID=1088 RepID=A0ABS1DCR2_9PROT|nr:YkvA family protein [Rhodovibrio sodomensis]MBK1668009.1 hypothetical protein [Rhodovibrio sodomensis]
MSDRDDRDYETTARQVTRYDPEKLERDRDKVLNNFWSKARRVLGRVPFLEDAVAAYYCARDPETPAQVKAVLFGALAYFILPTDLVPDILTAFGFVDDAAILTYAYRKVADYVTDAHRKQAHAALAQLRVEDQDAG